MNRGHDFTPRFKKTPPLTTSGYSGYCPGMARRVHVSAQPLANRPPGAVQVMLLPSVNWIVVLYAPTRGSLHTLPSWREALTFKRHTTQKRKRVTLGVCLHHVPQKTAYFGNKESAM